MIDIARTLAATDVASAIALLKDIPSSSPLHPEAERLQSRWQQRSIDRARMDEAIALAASERLADLALALDELESFPSESEFYPESRRQIESLLVKILISSSSTLDNLEPQVELDNQQITVSYASAEPLLLQDEGIRHVAIAAMKVLRVQFLGFNRLVVLSRTSDRQITMPLSLWLSYQAEDGIDLEQLLAELDVTER